MDTQTTNILRAGDQTGAPPDRIIYGRHVFMDDNILARAAGASVEISFNFGDTFDIVLNFPAGMTSDDIRFYHVFRGSQTIVIATHRVMYYSENWGAWQVTALKNADGTTFTPVLQHDNFFSITGTQYTVVAGQESLLFANYNNDENPWNQSGRGYAWLSTDYGKTLTCIFELNKTLTTAGQVVQARHLHTAQLDPYTGQIYLDMGDEDVNVWSHWVRGTRQPSGSWSWELLGSGQRRKTVGIFFDEQYIYCVLDFGIGGVGRYLRGEEGDTSNMVQLLTTINDCAGYILGNSGQLCVLQLIWNGSDVGHVLWYSRDKIDWHRVEVPLSAMPAGSDRNTTFYQFFRKADSRGRGLGFVFIKGMEFNTQYFLRPSVWVDDVLRIYGHDNAFI